MFFLIIVCVLYALLIAVSRRNIAEYKGKGVSAVPLGMAFTIYTLLKSALNPEKTRSTLRKLRVAGSKEIEVLTTDRYVRVIALILTIAFATAVAVGVVSYKETHAGQEIVLEREDYNGNEKEYEFVFSSEDYSETGKLKVAPVELTQEEFDVRARELFSHMEEKVMGEGGTFSRVSRDIGLPAADEGDVIRLEWYSHDPEYITSYGRILSENLKSDTTSVTLTAKAYYLDYETECDYSLTIVREVEEETVYTRIKKELAKLESEDRNQRQLMLPAEIDGVSISMSGNKSPNYLKMIIAGCILCIFAAGLAAGRLKEEERLRDDELKRQFPDFVSRLSLLIAAGMTIRAALREIIMEPQVKESEDPIKKNLLLEEIEYSINQINTGAGEAAVYEELGLRLGLPEYRRLFSNLSQGVSVSDEQLLKLMDVEISQVVCEQQNTIRERGEKSSTALLIPMVMLLAVTMLIVIFPAVSGF